MLTNTSLDSIKFLKKVFEEMRGDVSYAYPEKRYAADRGHVSLQMIASKIDTLNAFLNSLESTKED